MASHCQGQRYDVGQEFKPHTDYFEPDGEDYATYCAISGQRSWTFMIYLDDVSAGGGTRFPEINRTFQPERGALLAWNNRLADGTAIPRRSTRACRCARARNMSSPAGIASGPGAGR